MNTSHIDKSNMYESILNFPKHVQNSFDFFDKNSSISNNISENINNILILGMGGSAITGLLFREILCDYLDIPINIKQGYTIPKWVDSKTLVIASSYSGNTEETLIGLNKCKLKTTKIIAFTTGGDLYDFVLKNNYCHVLIPSGLQPRAALGYSFTLMLLMFNKIKFINDNIIRNFKESLTDLSKYSNIFSVPKNENICYQIAKKIYKKNPVIYSEDGIFEIIGYRLKCQLTENSKILAFNNCIPEMNHNEIEAYTKNANINNFIIIWIDDKDIHPRNKRRLDISKSILSEKIKKQIDIRLDLNNVKSSFVKYLIYINLMDWISYYAAILKNVDPSIIPNINELKKSL